MRYRTDQGPNEAYPYSESMHHMLTLTMSFSIVIGIIFVVAGTYGKILWLRVWGAALTMLSLGYLVADFLGYI